MIELKNLSKIYTPNKETKVHALNDINLTFGNTGMVFLLGKSGSGKTTLLNMIGGLDKPTQGEIIVDGKELNLHNEKEINKYRNNKIGFIFQNYGLLEDMSIKSNIDIALDLQNSYADKELVEDILQIVGLKECADKKVSQLSGGQKQRVAIARALIKNSQIILADEPTGNLDEKNSKEIFKILKQIAKTRLVIVVTHSQKFAQEFAERIITLKDGTIQDDITLAKISEREIKNNEEKNKFPLSTSFKFAFRSIWHVKLRFVLTLIFMIISLTMFGAGLSATRYSKYELYETAIKDNDIKGYTLVSSVYIDGKRSALQPEQLSAIQTKDSLITYFGIDFSVCYTKYENYRENQYVVQLDSEKHFYPDSIAIYDADKLTNQGIRLLKGQAPLHEDEIIITRYFAEGLLNVDDFRENYKAETMDDLIGMTIQCTSYGNTYSNRREIKLKIAGIVDANFNYDKMLSLDESMREQYASDGLNRTIFATEEFLQKQFYDYIEIKGKADCYQGYFVDIYDKPLLYLSRHFTTSKQLIRQSSYNLDMYGDEITWIEGHDKILKENEILMNQYTFYYIYNETKNNLVFTGIDKYDDPIISEKLNEGIEFELSFGEVKKKLKVVGLIKYNVFIIGDDLQVPAKATQVKSVSSSFDRDNIPDSLRSFEKNEITITGDLYEALQKASDEITPTVIFGILGFVIFGLFAVMMLTSFMSSMIDDNYKQLGILRALGASRGNLIGIYLLVATVLVVLCNIIAMPMLPLVKGFMQAKEIGEVVQGYVIFETKWYDYIIMLALSAGITFLGSIVHILTKTKATPIQMLKGKR